jgi:hypothetical protein
VLEWILIAKLSTKKQSLSHKEKTAGNHRISSGSVLYPRNLKFSQDYFFSKRNPRAVGKMRRVRKPDL